MPLNTSALALVSLFAAAWFSAHYNGGLDPGLLLSSWAGLLLTAAFLGPSAWSHSSRSHLYSGHGGIRTWQVGVAAVLLYAAGLASATVASPFPATAIELALRMALLPAGFVIARAAMRTGLPWAQVWSAFRLMAIMLAVFAVLERLTTGARAYTVLEDPNALAALFNVVLIAEFSRLNFLKAPDEPGRRALFGAAVLALFAAAQGATGSLSGLLCLGAALLPLAVFSSRGLPPIRRIKTVATAALIVMLAFACSGGTRETPAAKLQGLASHGSFTVRVEMMRASLGIYRDHAWSGSGLGTYKLYYPQYRSPKDTGTTGDLAHNDYIQFLQEGGPLLLAPLLLIGLLTTLVTARAVRQHPNTTGQPRDSLELIGAGFALMALLLHAGMNFIFYVAPLALLSGVLFARLIPQRTQDQVQPASAGQAMVLYGSLLAIGIALLATLGARALFVGLTTETCKTHACRELRSSLPFMNHLTAYLVGTQSTWLPARNHLIENHLAAEAESADASRKELLRGLAFREVLNLQQDAPSLYSPYLTLAELIQRDPRLAQLLPGELPHDAVGLYNLALKLQPYDLRIRLRVADILVKAGQLELAHTVLFEEGMRYWSMSEWGDGGRMQLLAAAIPIAASLHKCLDAKEMAGGLDVFVQLQNEASRSGNPLPTPPNGLAAPSTEQSQKALSAAAACN